MVNNDDKINDDSLSSYSFASRTKPLLALQTLFDALIPVSRTFSLQAGESHDLSPDREHAEIMILLEGTGVICHCENSMAIATIFSPTILGLIDGYSTYYDVPARPRHFFCAESYCSGHMVPLDNFVNQMDEKNLWHDVARVLAHRLMVMDIREKEFMGVDSFLMIRTLLLELYSYPQVFRDQINVLNFIQRRTLLSRSRILSILSELRKGEYININRGVLLSIDKKIPAVF